MAYYETVALVIAILFLALAVEARAFASPSGEPKPVVVITMLGLLVLLSVGEGAALFSLAERRDTGVAKGITAAAVACGGIGVVASIWYRQWEAVRGADRWTWLVAAVLFLGVGIGVATLVLLLAG